ncbi:MAG: uroporphyrinogen-III C-methyltransferase [Neisseriaceae bacterium]|nr:uroporphyrinogen-III C-methyltransferase [Neisseriaceae bacterium]
MSESNEINDALTAKSLPPKDLAAATHPSERAVPTKGTSAIGVLAFLISLGALGFSGWQYMEGRTAVTQIRGDLALTSANSDKYLDSFKAQVSQQQKLGIDTEMRLAALDNRVAAAVEGYEALKNNQKSELHNRLLWQINEANYVVNTAAQQLQVYGDVMGAVQLLGSLDEHLADNNDLALMPVRTALSFVLTELKKRPVVDVVALSSRLSHLSRGVDALVFPLDAQAFHADPARGISAIPLNDVAANVVSNTSWWQATWQTLKAQVGRMVEIRYLDSDNPALLSPSQLFFLKENAKLNLAQAKIALQQHQTSLYLQALKDLETQIRLHADTHAGPTQLWLEELQTLSEGVTAEPLPSLAEVFRSILAARRALTEGE